MKYLALFPALALRAGCGHMDRGILSNFEMMPSRVCNHNTCFRFTASGNTINRSPAADTLDEQTRLEWLRAELRERSMCPNGYRVLERRVFTKRVLIGRVFRTMYLGRCK